MRKCMQPTRPMPTSGKDSFLFLFFKFYLFTWLHQVFPATPRIFPCGTQALLLWFMGSGALALSCSVTAEGMLVPRPGIEPVLPALKV